MATTAERAIYSVGKFKLDDYTNRPITGYTSGQRWNGWACPYLDKTGADDLVVQLNASYERYGESRRAYYDATRDVYVTPYEGTEDEWDTWPPLIITVDGTEKRVYSIGAGGWRWIEADAD